MQILIAKYASRGRQVMQPEIDQKQTRDLHEPTFTQYEQEFSRSFYSIRLKLNRIFDWSC